jgi:hypothetical protein
MSRWACNNQAAHKVRQLDSKVKFRCIELRYKLRQVTDQLWKVHEAHLRDDRTGKVHILRTNTADWANTALGKLLDLDFTH